MKSPFSEPLAQTFSPPFELRDGMWVAVIRSLNAPTEKSRGYKVFQDDDPQRHGHGIRAIVQGNIQEIRAFATGEWDGHVGGTLYETTLVADFPFLVLFDDAWDWNDRYAVAQRLVGGELCDSPEIGRRPRSVAGVEGWDWTKLDELLELLSAGETFPYFALVSYRSHYTPPAPPESESWDVDQAMEWYQDNGQDFHAIPATLDNPSSKLVDVGCGEYDQFFAGEMGNWCPEAVDMANLGLNRIWIPTDLAMDMLYLDYFFKLKQVQPTQV